MMIKFKQAIKRILEKLPEDFDSDNLAPAHDLLDDELAADAELDAWYESLPQDQKDDVDTMFAQSIEQGRVVYGPPLDLRDMQPEDAARALFEWLQIHHGASEAILMDPDRSEDCGLGRVWRVMWEGGIYEWGVSLTCGGPIDAHFRGYRNAEGGYLQPQVLLLDAKYFVAEPYYSFDVGFYPLEGVS